MNKTLKLGKQLESEKVLNSKESIEKMRKRKIKTSIEKKYEFLVSMLGEDEEKIKKAKMDSGITYIQVRNSIQILYNSGKLNIEPEKIEVLKRNGILNLSTDEKKKLEKEYGISGRYAKKLIKKFGSVQDFVNKYKNGEANYDFENNCFIGSREIVVSEKDRTVAKKKCYVNLVKKLYDKIDENSSDRYINIDVVDKAMKCLTEREKEILTMYYLDIENKIFSQISKLYNISVERVSQIIEKAMLKIRDFCYINNEEIVVYGEKELEKEISDLQKREKKIKDIENILLYIYSNDIENINSYDIKKEKLTLEELGLYISEDELKEAFIKQDNIPHINSIEDIRKYKNVLENYLKKLYGTNLNKINLCKEKVIDRKRRQDEFMSFYEPLKKDFLTNENIFDPNYIIKGKKIKKIVPIKKNFIADDSIENLDISFQSLVSLHNIEIYTIQELQNRYNEFSKTNDKNKFLDSINGFDIANKDKLNDYLEKMYNREENKKTGMKIVEDINNKKEPNINIEIDWLNVNMRTKNLLKNAGIKTVKNILERYDNEQNVWDKILGERKFGPKDLKSLLNCLEERGYVIDGKPISITSKFDEQMGEKQEKNINIGIEWLNVNTRTKRLLKNEGINTVKDILKRYDSDQKNWDKILKNRKFGPKDLKNLLNYLEQKGFIVDGKPVNFAIEKKEELIADIEKCQNKLRKLQEELAKLNVELEIKMENKPIMKDEK